MVRFRCIRSNGNARKRHETSNGNTGYPSCFQKGLTCFCHVSVYGFLQFRPVPPKWGNPPRVTCLSRQPGLSGRVEGLNVIIVLTYIGLISVVTRKRVRQIAKRYSNNIDIELVFSSFK